MDADFKHHKSFFPYMVDDGQANSASRADMVAAKTDITAAKRDSQTALTSARSTAEAQDEMERKQDRLESHITLLAGAANVTLPAAEGGSPRRRNRR